jgi:hypothetical protein
MTMTRLDPVAIPRPDDPSAAELCDVIDALGNPKSYSPTTPLRFPIFGSGNG